MQLLRLSVSLCCLVLLTTACSAPVSDRFFWPLPPEEPRVEFIGVYSNEADMLKGGLASAAFSLTGGVDKPLQQISALTGDGHGKIYVSEGTKNNVKVLDFAKGTLKDVVKVTWPFGLKVDSKGNLYVVSRKNGEVEVFNPAQLPLFQFGAGVLQEPVHIAIDEERRRIYVSDRKTHQVQVFTLKGEHLQTIGGKEHGDKDGEFYRPYGLALDRSGNLYVSDQLNCRIQVFDPSGAFVRKFGIRGDTIDTFEGPAGMAFDNSGQLWIVDVRKAALITYDVSGTEPKFLFATLGPAASKGQYSFMGPVDIFIDPDNRLYVADGLMRRVAVWQYLDQAYLAKQPVPAGWQQRTDLMERWYKDSELTPPAKEKAEQPAPDSIFTEKQPVK